MTETGRTQYIEDGLSMQKAGTSEQAVSVTTGDGLSIDNSKMDLPINQQRQNAAAFGSVPAASSSGMDMQNRQHQQLQAMSSMNMGMNLPNNGFHLNAIPNSNCIAMADGMWKAHAAQVEAAARMGGTMNGLPDANAVGGFQANSNLFAAYAAAMGMQAQFNNPSQPVRFMSNRLHNQIFMCVFGN